MTFSAPWARSLSVMTALSVVVLLVVAVTGVSTGPRDEPLWLCAMIGLPLALLLGAAFFVIRDYRLTGQTLEIRRLGWSSRIDLTHLVSVEADPEAMARSLRLFGNGGLFCFAGLFRNQKLGNYRAFATDPRRAVVLRLDDRIVVVTPDDPDRFVQSVRSRSSS